MGCCSSQSEEPETFNNSSSIMKGSFAPSGGISDETMNLSIFPTWMDDSATDVCLGCLGKFSMLNRKHHCRRCRNVFCEECTRYLSPIIIYSIKEDVRVCSNCCSDLQSENKFYLEVLPALVAGCIFKRPVMMGLSSKLVTLSMSPNGTVLNYDEENRGDMKSINLTDIERVAATSAKVFEIATNDRKVRNFEAGSPSIQKQWLDGLKAAIDRAKKPTLRQTVDDMRKCRIRDAASTTPKKKK